MLTITKAVNELIQLNLVLHNYDCGDTIEDGHKTVYQRFFFGFKGEEGFDVIIHATGNKVGYVDFVYRDDPECPNDTHELFSDVWCMFDESLTEEKIVEELKERWFEELSSFYSRKAEKKQ